MGGAVPSRAAGGRREVCPQRCPSTFGEREAIKTHPDGGGERDPEAVEFPGGGLGRQKRLPQPRATEEQSPRRDAKGKREGETEERKGDPWPAGKRDHR